MGLPKNSWGWIAGGILSRVEEQGEKFSQTEVNYVPKALSNVCGTCRFYLRADEGELGQCQAVRGPISWRGTSDLYISAEDEAAASLANLNAYSGEEMADSSKSTISDDTTEETNELKTKAHLVGMQDAPVPVEVTSFDDLEAMEEAQEVVRDLKRKTTQMAEMSENIFINSEVEDKPGALQRLATQFVERVGNVVSKERWQPLTDKVVNKASDVAKQETPVKVEGGVRRRAREYAFTPDLKKPSTWKLPLTDDSNTITVSKLGQAAAAFSPGGFRGQRVQIPTADVARVKRRIRSEYRKLNVEDADIPPSVKEISAFNLVKQADGRYRWLAIYSNKFRDDDIPPEIIAEKSHKRFVQMVDSGEYPMPILKAWHVRGTRWGEADMVAYDDQGFAIATGLVDEGKENIAENMAKEKNLLVSHGMPISSIKRDSEGDNTVIIEHQTKEISPLPTTAAANKLTGFEILDNEVKQMIPDEKKTFLERIGYDVEQLESQTVADKAQQAEDEEREAKEIDSKELVTRQEVTELTEVLAKEVGGAIKVLAETVSILVKEVATLKQSDEEKIQKAIEATPAASFSSLFQKSIIGSEETLVDGRSKLAKDKPEEAKVVGPTDSPMLNSFLTQ